MSEAIAEAPTEQVTPQPEVELAPADESTPVEQESPEAPNNVDAYLESRGLAEEKTVTPEGEESPAEDAWLEELNPEHKARVEALLEQERNAKESQKRAYDAGRRRVFQNYRAWQKQTLERTDLTLEEITSLVDKGIEQYHDYSIQFAQEEVTEKTTEGYAKGQYAAAAKHLPTGDRDSFSAKQHESQDAFFKDYTEYARKGYVKESAVKSETAKEVKAAMEWLGDAEHPERLQAFTSKNRAPGLNGSGGSYNGKNVTYAQLTKMKPAEIEALPAEVFNKAVAEGK